MTTEIKDEDKFLEQKIESLLSLDSSSLEELLSDPRIHYKTKSLGYSIMYVPRELLCDPFSDALFDSYYDTVSIYKWHKTPIDHGMEFTQIFSLLDKIKLKYPTEETALEIICRKTAYLNALEMELEYISNRYKWDGRIEFKEVFLAKFENFTTSLVELIITCINIYEKLELDINPCNVKNFKDILPFIRNENNKLPSHYHLGINNSINISLYIFIRNSLVHNFDEIYYIENNQNPIVKIPNVPKNRRFGIFGFGS